MRRSTERILTTHTGSLPRPPGVPLPGTAAAAGGERASDEQIRDAVAETVRRQVEAGVDVVNDGEVSKPSYATYVTSRLTGFESRPSPTVRMVEADDFPDYYARLFPEISSAVENPTCTGPVRYRDQADVERDLANLRAAAEREQPTDVFMTAASPGVIALFMPNEHYRSEEDYIAALADAMKEEYDAIHASGFVLQIDCPDLAAGWPIAQAQGQDVAAFRRTVAQHVEAINHATRDIPPEAMRLHMCWGNYEGPHHRDLPLRDVVDLVLQARPQGFLFEGANPRHEHEWALFEEVEVPEGKVLVPGVLDSTTNYIEHPELVAQRIERLARLVGRENVMAGSDCGFATFAQVMPVDPAVTWAKLAAMAEGARIASEHLWGRSA
ncbi:MAG TPA: cobalamin-independent methionine synthase II family protein [Acidimicrobiia bacterium]|nr:cobalamin-independent methionine synthase II family protein [Acidimicrobiia bacterium]